MNNLNVYEWKTIIFLLNRIEKHNGNLFYTHLKIRNQCQANKYFFLKMVTFMPKLKLKFWDSFKLHTHTGLDYVKKLGNKCLMLGPL